MPLGLAGEGDVSERCPVMSQHQLLRYSAVSLGVAERDTQAATLNARHS
jgi:hypothetical protein